MLGLVMLTGFSSVFYSVFFSLNAYTQARFMRKLFLLLNFTKIKQVVEFFEYIHNKLSENMLHRSSHF
jgi:hypothetical protein